MRYILIFIFILLPSNAFVYNEIHSNTNIYKVATVISYTLEKHIDEKDTRDNSAFIRNIVPNLVHRYYFMNYSFKDSELILTNKSNIINEKVKKFNPNIITVYGISAFEHYLIKITLKENTKTIFYCIPDYHFLHLTQKYNLNINDLYGSIQRLSLYDLNEFLHKRNVSYSKIILLRNKRIQDDAISIKVKQFTDGENIKLDIIKVDTDSELKSALKSIRNESNVLVLYGLSIIKDQYDNEVTDYELAKIIEKYNTNLLEVSIIRNLAKYGIGISYIQQHSPESILNPHSECNSLFYNFFTGKKPINTTIINDSKILVNSNRLDELNLNSILSIPEGIQGIY